jgi:uncharacterized membrane protein YagU involved in acid resistance
MVELINSQNNDNWYKCILITSQKDTFVNLEVIWTNLNPHMSESFRVKLIWCILAEWFSRRKFFNDLTKVWHFCDYLPFEEELVLYLNNSESHLPKDDLYQEVLKLAFWFWRRRFFFFNINTCKYGFSIVAPADPCEP